MFLVYLKQTAPKLSYLPNEAVEGLKAVLNDCKQSPKIMQSQADDVSFNKNLTQLYNS